EVSLVMKSKTDSKIKHTPKFISGDIGEGKFYGRDRQIVWNFDQEFGSGGLDNDDLFIEITAEEVGWGLWGYSWRGTIVAAIGAAAYVYFTKEDKPVNAAISQPPPRPTGL
ncbi:MAG: hypothetical protein KKG93_12210, partial [Bacteroidetes bacterium]|nr:hypothetical protein [Bacteroidota bacterium]